MSNYRTGFAFLIAPLVSPLAVLLIYGFKIGAFPSLQVFFGAFIYYGSLAYIGTAVFGLPVFLLLRSSWLAGKLLALASGGSIGFAVGFVLFALAPGFTAEEIIEGYLTYTLTGALTGVVFWVIATRGRKQEEIRDSSSNDES
ncbi:MAG TPA: hypothetical protein VFQ47_05890 [Nitrososphaera sp.]|jgi:hypothetical protein|nr:hypothetical protein [Nitrososphaera sp.]